MHVWLIPVAAKRVLVHRNGLIRSSSFFVVLAKMSQRGGVVRIDLQSLLKRLSGTLCITEFPLQPGKFDMSIGLIRLCASPGAEHSLRFLASSLCDHHFRQAVIRWLMIRGDSQSLSEVLLCGGHVSHLLT